MAAFQDVSEDQLIEAIDRLTLLLNDPKMAEKVESHGSLRDSVTRLDAQLYRIRSTSNLSSSLLTSSLTPSQFPALCDEILEWLNSPASFYDEMYAGPDQFREAYRTLGPIIRQICEAEPNRFAQFNQISLRSFRKDNSLYHIPRMLTESEFSTLFRGVTQRATAIRAFLKDFYSRRSNDPAAELPVPHAVLEQILHRSCEERLLTKLASPAMRNNWGFWYGPDLIRASSGEFFVVEDNLGYVGGLGDISLAQSLLRREFPEFQPALAEDKTAQFFSQIAAQYRAMSDPGKVVVLLHYPRRVTADNEEMRLIKLMKAENIYTVVIPFQSAKAKKSPKLDRRFHLVIDEHFNVTLTKNRRSQKRGESVLTLPVGCVIIDAEAYDADPTNPIVKRKAFLDEASGWMETYTGQLTRLHARLQKRMARSPSKHEPAKLLNKIQAVEAKRASLQELISKSSHSIADLRQLARFLRSRYQDSFQSLLEQGVPGLLKAFFRGKICLINGPGFDFVGDKLFCTYVDSIIKHYLGEEPILKSIPTLSFASNPELITQVFDHPEIQNVAVVKRVDGRGGDSVWVGCKISRTEFYSVKEKVISEPNAFIVQKYLSLSQLDEQLVDLRVLSSVNMHEIVISETFWGRGVPAATSNGKVNISDQGFEFAICVSKSDD